MNHHKEYAPIACSSYDVLESSAVKKTLLKLSIEQDNATVQRNVKILDLFSQEKVEYAKVRDDDTGEEFSLRLDTIRLIRDVATNTLYSPMAC